MTIDIRARVYCSLGPIISGEISDSSVVDNGLVTTTGSVILSGLYKPSIGTLVQFSYAKNGNLVKIPRRLVVLSSFADPFRKQTTVQLGCWLTYKANAAPLPSEEPDTQPTFSLIDSYRVPPTISASTIFTTCASRIGLGATAPLTNRFILDEFDYSGGYVSTMADLLKSECYFGHINSKGGLSVKTLQVVGGGGPVLNSTNIIDIGSMGSTDVPGEAVSVSYESKTLAPPNDEAQNGPGADDINRGNGASGEGGAGDRGSCNESEIAQQKRNWEFEQNLADEVTVYDQWTNAQGEQVVDKYEFSPWSTTRTTYDVWDRAVYRFEVQNGLIDQVWRSTWFNYEVPAPLNTGSTVDNPCSNWWWNDTGEGSLADQYGSGRFSFTIETDEESLDNGGKPDNYSNIVMEETWEDTPKADIIQACGFAETWFPNIASLPIGRQTTLIQYIYYEKDELSGITKTRTERYIPYVQTPEGGYSIGKRAEVVSVYDGPGLQDSVVKIISDASQLVRYGGETRIRTEREYGLQRRPGAADRLSQQYQRQAPIEQEAELGYALGSDNATSAISFDMPYAPDDIITSTVSGSQITYSVEPSDAGIKARNYGRVQNRLLIGSNSGLSIQIAPENMPPYPMMSIYINLNGLTGNYKTNAQSWVFDANGIIAGCDALFWGGVGGS